ncbi:hypothetical protein DY052_09130 [Apilactobacillus timberlakei]|uniref:ATPase, T2SS/T4P/T4SS family n=1 Tax=Apilactobacillus timberlakei TaxID=2008380 RepID=UPI0011269A43|nr:ATPase, T2SS/T4P/T4SS family [Apilactobacillus timberlakei]TPR12811.1 hypothetical protein DY052_09130 [Apilactobacillus timberlakei]
MVKKAKRGLHFFKPKNNNERPVEQKDLHKLIDDGKRSKFEDLGVTNDAIKAIRTLLANNYSNLVIDAFSHPDLNKRELSFNRIVEVLNNYDDFSIYATHHNPEASRAAAEDVVGMGIFGRLLKMHDDLTDMGYNGTFAALETPSVKERYKGIDENGEPLITPAVTDRFVEMFAKADNKSFNKSQPIFNGFRNNMRISATHWSLTPNHHTTLSIRISKPKLALNHKNFYKFANIGIYTLLDECMKSHANVLISGETGTGKTELYKLLVGSVSFSDKIINIEDVDETHLSEIYPDKDIYNWLTKTMDTKTGTVADKTQIRIEDHVKNGLRNNSKWTMVSEVRGGDAFEMFQSAKTGQPMMTTLHSVSNAEVNSRFSGMAMQNEECKNPDEVSERFNKIMHLGIHIKRKDIGGTTYRYLDDLSCFVPIDDAHPDGVAPIYKQELHSSRDQFGALNITRTSYTYKMPQKIIDLVKDIEDYDLVGHLLRDNNLDFTGNGRPFEESINY